MVAAASAPRPVLEIPESAAGATVQSLLARPGLGEKAHVILTTFILLHQIPNAWFRTRADALADTSNPLLVVITLGLIGVALLRLVAGSIDHLIQIVRLEVIVFAFAGLTFASMFWSADPSVTLRRSIVFLSVTFFAGYLVMRFSLDQIVVLLAVMFTISAIVNTAFVFGLPEYGLDNVGRMTGVYSQKNALGYTAALAVPLLIVAGRTLRPARFIFYPIAALHLFLLVGSESKTMLLATLGPTLLMAVYHLFRSRRTLRGAVISSLVGLSVFAIAFATANIGLLARWLDKDVSLTGRIPMWENLLPIALERPLTGHGYAATFDGFFSPVHELWIQTRWNPSHAHNALLQIWLEMGIVAVVLFLIIYFRGVARATKVVALVPGAVGLWPLAYLTTTLLISITESGVTSEPTSWMIFVVAMLSVSLHLHHRASIGLSNDLRAATAANAQARRARG